MFVLAIGLGDTVTPKAKAKRKNRTRIPMLTKAQDNRRHKLLGLDADRNRTGLAYFQGLSADSLATLVEEGFADPHMTQNSSPSIGVFLSYMKAHPKVTAHGYVVSTARDDARVSIEGLHSGTADEEEQNEFLAWNESADELNKNRSWWD